MSVCSSMRLLLLHCEYFEYTVREQAIKTPEEIEEASRAGRFENILVAFCTVEKEDEPNPDEVVTKATESIAEVADSVKTNRLLVYPYAHLSSSLAGRDIAISSIRELAQRLRERGYEVHRSPFGYYKSFNLKCLGHPLSELSRTIRPEQAKAARKRRPDILQDTRTRWTSSTTLKITSTNQERKNSECSWRRKLSRKD